MPAGNMILDCIHHCTGACPERSRRSELNSTDSGISTHKFTGDERDAETSFDHTQFRQYTSQLARWMTPDPAGLAAVDPSNPQSWNRYAYVLNNPLNSIDPSGMDLCDVHVWDNPGCFGGGGGFGPGSMTCYQDSVVTDCGVVNRNIDLGIAVQCPNNDCGPRTGNNGSLYPIVYTDDGFAYKNPSNGDTFASASELGLSSLEGSGLPSNLALGTPQKYWGPFKQGFNAALNDLKRPACGAFFGGEGAKLMGLTTYRFLDLGSASSGASTLSATDVAINFAGPYMTYSPVPGRAGPFGVFWTQSQFRAFILLHELGHQLDWITGFQADAGAGKLSLNQAQSRQVINACGF